ncbi:hypothetical protein BDQ17DRAFT_1230096 [Cyathus striatus]|nr:hypothetical protein BDQ17DRAFT_1230096 [Cyathus striatus]
MYSNPPITSRYHSPSSSSILKRTHPKPVGRSFHAANVPLPKIAGDVILEVFTHRSLGRKTTSDDYGDNERLSELGKASLEAILTEVLFKKRPLLRADELCLERDSILSDENIDDWVTYYNLRKKLRCHPDFVLSLNTPQETRSIFYAYIGGLYSESGDVHIREWICRLIETAEPMSHSAMVISTSPGRHLPPHFPNPLAPAQPGLSFLPLFNQTAMQRRVTVEYLPEFCGPSHAGKWTVRCVVNGIPKGIGTGSSKQVAKEEAARQAYYAMGWT